MTTSRNDLLLPDLPEFLAGWVWLVGAGPGDPGLLTLHALHALRSADVIIYDALVDERILRLAGNMAELVYAGKRGGKPSPKQPDISNRIIRLAQAGKRVCRLKGGDPFVFGRGGEEGVDETLRLSPGEGFLLAQHGGAEGFAAHLEVGVLVEAGAGGRQ